MSYYIVKVFKETKVTNKVTLRLLCHSKESISDRGRKAFYTNETSYEVEAYYRHELESNGFLRDIGDFYAHHELGDALKDHDKIVEELKSNGENS